MATAGADGLVKLWPGDAAEEIITLDAGGKRVNGIAFSPDGQSIAAANVDGTITVWDSSLATTTEAPTSE